MEQTLANFRKDWQTGNRNQCCMYPQLSEQVEEFSPQAGGKLLIM